LARDLGILTVRVIFWGEIELTTASRGIAMEGRGMFMIGSLLARPEEEGKWEIALNRGLVSALWHNIPVLEGLLICAGLGRTQRWFISMLVAERPG
jgi:hypothetical protein